MTGRAFAPLPREETEREVELLLQVGEPLQPHLPCHALASTPANAGAASEECMSPLGLASIAERRQVSGPQASGRQRSKLCLRASNASCTCTLLKISSTLLKIPPSAANHSRQPTAFSLLRLAAQYMDAGGVADSRAAGLAQFLGPFKLEVYRYFPRVRLFSVEIVHEIKCTNPRTCVQLQCRFLVGTYSDSQARLIDL